MIFENHYFSIREMAKASFTDVDGDIVTFERKGENVAVPGVLKTQILDNKMVIFRQR